MEVATGAISSAASSGEQPHALLGPAGENAHTHFNREHLYRELLTMTGDWQKHRLVRGKEKS